MRITGDQLDAEQNSNSVIARHNAVLETPTLRLEADTISLDKADGQAEASGQVKLTQKALRVLTRKASYDMQKQQITAEMLRMGKPPLYIEGRDFTSTCLLYTSRCV